MYEIRRFSSGEVGKLIMKRLVPGVYQYQYCPEEYTG